MIAALCSLILWPIMWALSAVLWVIGLPVCAWLAYTRNWRLTRSYRNPDRFIAVWRPRWAWVWSNNEDGVTGHPGWQDRYASSDRLGTFIWSALRNPSNNLRFVPFLSLVIDPSRIGYVGNDDDPPKRLEEYPPVGDVKWSFVWQLPYAGFVYRRQLTATRHFQVRLGWKLLPKDRNGVADDDYRKLRCGFGTQLHLWREG